MTSWLASLSSDPWPTSKLPPFFWHAQALAGKFVLDGQEVELPVGAGDSLPQRVEALRMFLEEKLGTKEFLKVRHVAREAGRGKA